MLEESTSDSSEEFNVEEEESKDIELARKENRSKFCLPTFLLTAATEESDCKNSMEEIPLWFDQNLFEIGKQFYEKYFFSIYVGCLSGLLLLLNIPSILDTLIFTGKSDTKEKAFLRYLQTILHMDTWYKGNMWNVDDNAHKSLNTVRKIHTVIANQQSKVLPKEYHPAISQSDMVITQFAFMGLIVTKPLKLGVWATKKELEGFIHFWRNVGYLLGIDDKYNICCGSYEETLIKCEDLVKISLRPAALSPPSDFSSMSKALMQGMQMIVPFLEYHTFLDLALNLIDISYKNKNKYYHFVYYVQWLTFRFLLFLSPMRRFLNHLMKLALKQAEERAQNMDVH